MVQTICICGAGTMGNGIAQVAAMHGFNTLLYDVNKEMLGKALDTIEKNLQSLVDKNKISQLDKTSALNRTRLSNNLNDCIADVIIEAIIEEQQAKISLFNQLAE